MPFVLTFETNGAAFADAEGLDECARILQETARRLRTGQTSGGILDANGNTVGSWTYKQAG